MLMQILGGSESDLLHEFSASRRRSTSASDMRDGSGEFVCWAVSIHRAEEVSLDFGLNFKVAEQHLQRCLGPGACSGGHRRRLAR